MHERTLARRFLDLLLSWREERELRIAAEKALLARIELPERPRRRTSLAVEQMTPVPERHSEIKAICTVISQEATRWLRARIHDQVGEIDEADAHEIVRGWLQRLDESLMLATDFTETLTVAIGPRWHHLTAACHSRICDDPRVWRYLVLLFTDGDQVLGDALWLAWESAHVDSRDLVPVSEWRA